eukprot:scaffold1439_cov404-Prasinococcus_capsulatus_cf.AAC.59
MYSVQYKPCYSKVTFHGTGGLLRIWSRGALSSLICRLLGVRPSEAVAEECSGGVFEEHVLCILRVVALSLGYKVARLEHPPVFLPKHAARLDFRLPHVHIERVEAHKDARVEDHCRAPLLETLVLVWHLFVDRLSREDVLIVEVQRRVKPHARPNAHQKASQHQELREAVFLGGRLRTVAITPGTIPVAAVWGRRRVVVAALTQRLVIVKEPLPRAPTPALVLATALPTTTVLIVFVTVAPVVPASFGFHYHCPAQYTSCSWAWSARQQLSRRQAGA